MNFRNSGCWYISQTTSCFKIIGGHRKKSFANMFSIVNLLSRPLGKPRYHQCSTTWSLLYPAGDRGKSRQKPDLVLPEHVMLTKWKFLFFLILSSLCFMSSLFINLTSCTHQSSTYVLYTWEKSLYLYIKILSFMQVFLLNQLFFRKLC